MRFGTTSKADHIFPALPDRAYGTFLEIRSQEVPIHVWTGQVAWKEAAEEERRLLRNEKSSDRLPTLP